MKNVLLVSAFVITFLGQACFANPSIEQKIVEQIDKELSQSVETLKKVVNINSGTSNFDGVREVGDIFRIQFDELGFKTQWIDGSSFNRSGHLVASYGSNGPKILMIGHLDTVFAKSDAFQSYVALDNEQVAGPGITDMKGGDVIIVSVLSALKKLNLLDKVRIQVVMTGDEESSGKPLSASKKAIIEGAKWADIALGFEDGDSNLKTEVIARRGSIN